MYRSIPTQFRERGINSMQFVLAYSTWMPPVNGKKTLQVSICSLRFEATIKYLPEHFKFIGHYPSWRIFRVFERPTFLFYSWCTYALTGLRYRCLDRGAHCEACCQERLLWLSQCSASLPGDLIFISLASIRYCSIGNWGVPSSDSEQPVTSIK